MKIDKLRNEVARVKEENGFTNRELGILCDGISCSTISRLLTGDKKTITKKTQMKFMKLFDLNENEIEAMTIKEKNTENKNYEILEMNDVINNKKYLLIKVKGKKEIKVNLD